MHVPPYHKKRSWQIFIVGIWTGALIGYVVLVFMYGTMYEKLLSEKLSLQTEVKELKRQNDALLEDKEDLEEKSKPVILSISIDFLNSESLHLDKLITHQLEDLVKNELDSIIGKEVESIAENDQLIIDLIQNKTYTIDDLSFTLQIRKISITQKVTLTIQMKQEN